MRGVAEGEEGGAMKMKSLKIFNFHFQQLLN